jgi:hypothetical protein
MRYLKSLILGLLFVPVLGVAMETETIPDDKAVITFESKKGTVTFFHALHATLRVTECGSCHHTYEPGQAIKPCSDCHKKQKTKIEGFSVVAPKNSKAYHTRCKGCHKYTMEELKKPAGPTKCQLCHIKVK